MGWFVSASGRKNKKETPATSLRLQTSVQGRPRTIGAGQNRIAGNLIWYGDFAAAKAKAGGSKGGGGKSGAAGFVYSASFLLSIAEGPIADVLAQYVNNAIGFFRPPSAETLTDLADIGVVPGYLYNSLPYIALGGYDQSPWGFLASTHAAQALSYRGQAVVGYPNCPLGSTTTLPNISYEVLWAIHGATATIPDANPADWVLAVLTNPDWGVPGFPAALVGDLSNFRTYAQAYGLFVSPVLADPTAAQSHLSEMLKACAADFRWSQGSLSIVPYADVAATGYGATWLPASTPVMDLDARHFLPVEDGSRAAITTRRPATYDSINQLAVEFLDRSSLYNPVTLYASDDAAVAQVGRERRSDPRAQHFFCRRQSAAQACILQLMRERTLRSHSFRLPEQFVRLDPFDIVTLTDPRLGYDRLPVRITEIQGNADRSLTFTAEDAPGTLRPIAYSVQKALGAGANTEAPPGPTNAPIVFEPPAGLASGQIWLAASGASPSTWGGCNVWLSLDGNQYTQIGVLTGADAQGVTTNALPAGTAGAIDTSHTLGVDLTLSGGTLVSVSDQAFQAYASLSYLDGELIAYRDAILAAAGQFTLSTLARGLYGTAAAAHAAGVPFAALSGSVFTYAYPPSLVGRTIWIKLPAFNLYGGGIEDLSGVTAYSYTVKGQAGSAPAYVQDANHTVVPSETAVYYTSLTITRTVTLPPSGQYPAGQALPIADQGGSASSSIKIVIAAASGQTINGAATASIASAYGAVSLTPSASGWTITSRTGS